MAEGEGFEPSVELPPQRFSRPSHSTALAPLRTTANSMEIEKALNSKKPPGISLNENTMNKEYFVMRMYIV
jgi:hypothetical protein